MIQKLSGIVSIKHVVFYFRSSISPCADGEIAIVQMKNITENGEICVDHMGRTRMLSQYENFLLCPNDILVLVRSVRNTATVVAKTFPKAVATSGFFVLRAMTKDVLPEYLALYLNHPMNHRE